MYIHKKQRIIYKESVIADCDWRMNRQTDTKQELVHESFKQIKRKSDLFVNQIVCICTQLVRAIQQKDVFLPLFDCKQSLHLITLNSDCKITFTLFHRFKKAAH